MMGKRCLKRLSFNVFEGDMIALMGKNASGNTTLVKLMNGAYKPRKQDPSIVRNKYYPLEELIKR